MGIKDYFTKKDFINITLTIIYKTMVYLGWYSFAMLFAYFIRDSLTDNNILSLIIAFIITYVVRSLFKYFYRVVSKKNYHQIKHRIEMYYFKKFKYLHVASLMELDKEFMANKILELSYNITRMFYDIAEVFIPLILGSLILFNLLFKINILLGLAILAGFGGLIYLHYLFLLKNRDETQKNYNDLLKDFVIKFDTIKKLNIFDYCYKRLDNNQDNDMCILNNQEMDNDNLFSNCMFALLAVILLTTFVLVDNNITALGLILCFITIIFKLNNVLYAVNNACYNISDIARNRRILESYLMADERLEYVKTFKKINIKDGEYSYKDSNIKISIPDFELINGDQISIMGKSGQGKSTILNVLSGMALNSGEIYFDSKKGNKAIDAVHISRSTDLFNISLRDNLDLGKTKTDSELIELLKDIGLFGWLTDLSNGLDTIMDERVIHITTKEKQKLNLLRGFILDKNVYFLDEPTYDLDIDSEKIVAAMIKKYLKKKTFIIVTHRPLLTTICKKHYFMKEHTLLESEPLL